MASWLLFFLIFLPFLWVFHLRKNQKTKKIHRPPGPPGLPLIGNLHQFESAKPHVYLRNLANQYGPIFSLKLGSVPLVVISSAKLAKEALKTHDIIFAGRPNRVLNRKASYNGLDIAFSSYSDYWREMKKISFIHLFTAKRVKSFRPILEDEVNELMKEISDISSSSAGDRLIDLGSMITNLTCTLICRIAFGKKFAKHDSEKERFCKMLHEAQVTAGAFYVSDYFPLLGWIDKVSGALDRLDRNVRDMDSFYQELIDEHLDPNRPESMKDDIIDLLIQIKEEQSSPFQLTWDHIKAVLMNIFVAATDTSATTVVWAMTKLMQNPPVMKRVQDEIRATVGVNKVIGEEELQKLTYLDAVIKETFRLHPPLPILLPRESIGDCSLEGYDIQAKTMIFVNAWAIARDPENWPNPEDFIPERFLNSNIDIKGNDFELLPFGSGRRGCPGITMGLTNVKFLLASLLYSYDWKLPSGMKVQDIDTDTLPGIVMHKKIPLCLVAKKYN